MSKYPKPEELMSPENVESSSDRRLPGGGGPTNGSRRSLSGNRRSLSGNRRSLSGNRRSLSGNTETNNGERGNDVAVDGDGDGNDGNSLREATHESGTRVAKQPHCGGQVNKSAKKRKRRLNACDEMIVSAISDFSTNILEIEKRKLQMVEKILESERLSREMMLQGQLQIAKMLVEAIQNIGPS